MATVPSADHALRPTAPADVEATPRRRRSGRASRLTLILALAWLALIVLAAGLADLLPLGEATDPSLALTQPVSAPPTAAHPLGTDEYGLDRLGQLVFGARVSLLVGLGGVTVGLVIGSMIGTTAAFLGGRVDGFVGFVTDAVLSFPPLVLLMTLATVLRPSIPTVSLALGALAIPTFVRLSRANALRASQLGFVTMSRALGSSNVRILVRGILPNILPPLLSFALLLMAVLIVAEASLSFLGLSLQPPEPSWGNMIAAAETRFQSQPIALAPALALFFTVFAVNRVGDHLSRGQEGSA